MDQGDLFKEPAQERKESYFRSGTGPQGNNGRHRSKTTWCPSSTGLKKSITGGEGRDPAGLTRRRKDEADELIGEGPRWQQRK